MARLHVWIEGTVQGVFFRDSTRQTARSLGLAGWVKNLSDGRVEAVFEGDEETCRKALEFVQVGPPGAQVDRVVERWDEAAESLTDFELRF